MAESPSRPGPPLVYATKSDATLQRPDKLRVIISGDGPASEFYYDGETMMAYAPAENLLALADAPPTIDAMLEAAYRSAGIFFPFDDVIVADPYKDMAGGMKLLFTLANPTWSRDHDGHGGIHQQGRVRAAVDRRRGQTPGCSGQFSSTIPCICAPWEFTNWQRHCRPRDAFTPSDTANAKRNSFAHLQAEPKPGNTAPGAPPSEKKKPPKVQQ